MQSPPLKVIYNKKLLENFFLSSFSFSWENLFLPSESGRKTAVSFFPFRTAASVTSKKLPNASIKIAQK